MRYLCQCDRCGKQQKMRLEANYGMRISYELPKKWEENDAGDLCPQCAKEFDQEVKKKYKSLVDIFMFR